MREHKGMRPHDVVVLLEVLYLTGRHWQNKDLAFSLGISQAEITNSLRRSDLARLYDKISRSVNRNNLFEFIVHGLPYVFPTSPGTIVNGVPTAHSHPFFERRFSSELKFVWPDAEKNERGLAVEPFYFNQVKAANSHKELYLLLACIDILRVGRVREKEMAKEILRNRIINERPE